MSALRNTGIAIMAATALGGGIEAVTHPVATADFVAGLEQGTSNGIGTVLHDRSSCHNGNPSEGPHQELRECDDYSDGLEIAEAATLALLVGGVIRIIVKRGSH